MANFSADTTTLTYQSDLHSRIAQYYRDAYNTLFAQSEKIIAALRSTDRADAAAQYAQWEASLDNLIYEADAHQTWSDYLAEIAQGVTQAEGALG